MAGYVEVHIEQGPVLDELALPVGVVTAIAGQTGVDLVFSGEAGHAGTVPMVHRRDALVAAARFVVATDEIARATAETLATVGRLTTTPGVANVIPSSVALSLNVRHADDAQRKAVVHELHTCAFELAAESGTSCTWQWIHDQPAVRCDSRFGKSMAEALLKAGVTPHFLVSGAGHDAAVVSRVVPVALLFVRSPGGISHHPAETVKSADVAIALDALGRFLRLIDQSHVRSTHAVKSTTGG
jgi:allantoate deiminase